MLRWRAIGHSVHLPIRTQVFAKEERWLELVHRIGCHLSVADGYLSMGETALAIGADTMQFFTRNPRGSRAKAIDREDVRRFLAFCDEHGIGDLLAHAPYTLNPCSANPDTRQFALETMREDLQRLELLPHSMYNFHPGCHTGQGVQTGIEQIASLLNTILQEVQTTTVLLETMAGKGSEIGGRFEELKAILERVERPEHMGVCIDTCHVHDAGYDIVHDLDGVLEEFDRVVGLRYLKAIHCNDSLNPLGSRKDRHARLGEGRIGLEAFRALVCHPALQGLPIELETPNDLAGYAAEIRLLRTMETDK